MFMMHICVYICIMFTYIFISIKQKQDGAADAQQQRAHVAAGYPCSSHPRPGARKAGARIAGARIAGARTTRSSSRHAQQREVRH